VSADENDIPNESCPGESSEITKAGEYIGDSLGGPRIMSTPPNGSALALKEITHATEVNSSDR